MAEQGLKNYTLQEFRFREGDRDVHANSTKFQEQLEAKLSELSLSCSNRDEIRIENAAEDLERLQQRMDRELAIRNLDRDSRLLRSVEEALDRINNGVFGICLRCEDAIPEKRLNAVPWTPYCFSCQEELDRLHDTGELEDDSNTFLSAA
jgi:DnaK suppressor protein